MGGAIGTDRTAAAVPLLSEVGQNNKCIGDDTKAAARRSPNCIRKTKKYVL